MSVTHAGLGRRASQVLSATLSALIVLGPLPASWGWGAGASAQDCTTASNSDGSPPGPNRRRGGNSKPGEPYWGSPTPGTVAIVQIPGSNTVRTVDGKQETQLSTAANWVVVPSPGKPGEMTGSTARTYGGDFGYATGGTTPPSVTPPGADSTGPQSKPGQSEPAKGDRKLGTGADPVNIATGEVNLADTDIAIGDLRIERRYMNHAGIESRMGYEWFPSFHARIVRIQDGSLMYLAPGGGTHRYEYDATLGGYTTERGNFDFLFNAPSESGGAWIVRTKHGMEYHFGPEGALRMTKLRGRRVFYEYLADSSGALVRTPIKGLVTVAVGAPPQLRVVARDFQLTRIRDFADRDLELAYDANGRLASVTDYTGRVWRYDVTDDGTLRSVTNPAGEQTSYTYYTNVERHRPHLDRNLKTVTDAMGQLRLTLFYDKFDRVTAQIEGDRTWTFTYGDYTTTLTDPRGASMIHDFAPDIPGTARRTSERRIVQKSLGVGGTDPVEYVQELTRDADGLTTAVKLPDGSVVEDTVDSWGNLIESRRKPAEGPDNDAVDLVKRTTYEARYHYATREVDPMGFETRYIYDYMEDEVRFQKDYDGNLTIANVDHNGDGITNQDFGAVVKLIFTPVTVYVPGGTPFVRQTARLFRYNALGDLTETVNAQGVVTRHEYYGPTDLVGGASLWGWERRSIEDAGGLDLATTSDRNAIGMITRLTDARGSWTEFDLDVLGRPTRAKSCPIHYENEAGTLTLLNDGYETRWAYDRSGNVVREDVEDDATGGLFTAWFRHDVHGQLVEVRNLWDGAYVSKRYEFDAAGNPTAVIMPNGVITRKLYDERGLTVSVTDGADSPDAATTRYEYDAGGRPVRVVDPEGRETRMAYDAFGRMTQVTRADGTVETHEMDKLGRPTKVRVVGKVDLSGTIGLLSEERMDYDEADRLVARHEILVDPLDTSLNATLTSRTGYDEMGNIVFVEDPLGRLETFAYDAVSRMSERTDPAGNKRRFTRDAAGNQVEDINIDVRPDGSTRQTAVRTAWDERGRAYRVENPMGGVVRLKLTSRDKVAWVQDEVGHKTEHQYNSHALVTRTTRHRTDGGGALRAVTTDFAYDTNLQLAAVTDDNGHTTRYEYNKRGLVTLERYGADTSDETTVQYILDRADNRVRRIDHAGQVTDQVFDALDRPVRITYHDGLIDEFAYDGLGRALEAKNNRGSLIRRLHDTLGRTRRETQDGRSVESRYDANSARIALAYPDGTTVAVTRDALNRATELRIGTSAVARYRYFGVAKVAEREFPEPQVLTTTTFDSNDRIISYGHVGSAGSGTTIRGFDYGYDATGNRLFRKHVHLGGAGERHTYDEVDRLVRVAYGCTDPSVGEAGATSVTGYALDGVGNRQATTTDGTTTRYTIAGPHNEYDAVGALSRAHDANGNVTDDGRFRFVFDANDQLLEVRRRSDDAILAQFAYDALGRRIRKQAAGTTTRYVYDGLAVILEYRQGGTGPEALHARYVLGNGLDEVLVAERDSGTGFVRRYHVDDALGSVSAVVSSSGAIDESYEYDVYGALRASRTGSGAEVKDAAGAWTTGIGNPHYFAGLRFDFEVGLYHVRARYYAPDVGRFVSRDPSGYEDGMNLYEYAKSNPVSLIDPLGTRSQSAKGALKQAYRQAQPYFRAHGVQNSEQRNAIKSDIKKFEATVDKIDKLMAAAADPANKKHLEEIGDQINKLGQELDAIVQDFEAQLNDLLNNWPSAQAYYEGFVNLLKSGSLLDIVSGALNIIGMLGIPGVSDLADLASIGIDFSRGRMSLSEAVIFSLAAATPLVGSGAVRLGRTLAGAFKEGKTFQRLGRQIEGALAKAKCKTHGLLDGQPHCFPAGTLVATSAGLLPIESVCPGDLVLSQDVRTGEFGYMPVLEVSERVAPAVLRLQFASGGTIDVTPEHPFHLGDDVGGWVPATRLTGHHATAERLVAAGDQAGVPSGFLRVCRSVVQITGSTRSECYAPVYNLVVAEWHAYYVGTDLLLVHNGSCGNSWSTARRNYWKEHGPGGQPPRRVVQVRYKDGTTGTEVQTRELHHRNGRGGSNPHRKSNLEEVWPDEHAKRQPPGRHVNYTVVKVVKDLPPDPTRR